MEAAGADATACGGCVVSSGALAGGAVVTVRWARCNGCGALDSAPQAVAAATVSVAAVGMVAAMVGAVCDEAPCGGAVCGLAGLAVGTVGGRSAAAVGSGGRRRGRAVGSAAVGRGGQRRWWCGGQRRWWSRRRAQESQWHGRQRHSRRLGGRCVRCRGAVATAAGADAVGCAVVGAVGAARLASPRLVCTVEDREEDAPPRSLAIGWLSEPRVEPGHARLPCAMICRRRHLVDMTARRMPTRTHTAQHAWRGHAERRAKSGSDARCMRLTRSTSPTRSTTLLCQQRYPWTSTMAAGGNGGGKALRGGGGARR